MYKKKGVPKEYKGFFGRNKLLVAATTLIGTTIGAGILGIPYVVSQTGFLYGFIIIVAIGIAALFLNLFTGEIVLRTNGQHQLTGYAGKYLGPWGKRLMTFALLFSIYGALTAYLIGEGATLHAIFKIGSPIFYTLIFFVVTLFIVYKGVKATGKAELFLISGLFLTVILIGVFSYNSLDTSFLRFSDITKIFIPYGLVVFAYLASPAIPELQEELGESKDKLKKAIIIGSIVPIIIYIIFTFIILGIVGFEDFQILEPNQRIATVALSVYANPILSLFANILAVLAMFTSFLTLGIALVEVYEYDYGLSRNMGFFLTFLIPLIITVFNLTTFISILGLSGALAGGLEGILVTLTFWRAKKLGDRTPEYSLSKMRFVGFILILMFGLGVLLQLWNEFF